MLTCEYFSASRGENVLLSGNGKELLCSFQRTRRWAGSSLLDWQKGDTVGIEDRAELCWLRKPSSRTSSLWTRTPRSSEACSQSAKEFGCWSVTSYPTFQGSNCSRGTEKDKAGANCWAKDSISLIGSRVVVSFTPLGLTQRVGNLWWWPRESRIAQGHSGILGIVCSGNTAAWASFSTGGWISSTGITVWAVALWRFLPCAYVLGASVITVWPRGRSGASF